MNNANQIVKQVVLDAPLERVWHAVTDSRAFGAWFGAEVEGDFQAGARLRAKIRPTRVDAEIARSQEPYEGMEFVLAVERVEPMRLFSFRWHPGSNEAGPDTPDAEMTLVEFVLEDTRQGVRLTITESGFERVPLARRAQAIADNTGGWAAQAGLIAKYLQQQAG
ncbi:MAG: SRPBCC family protein [Pseudomonadota bacterium]|nr:SRPBCC family protein [Pseudomonadota bacterium]